MTAIETKVRKFVKKLSLEDATKMHLDIMGLQPKDDVDRAAKEIVIGLLTDHMLSMIATPKAKIY